MYLTLSTSPHRNARVRNAFTPVHIEYQMCLTYLLSDFKYSPVYHPHIILDTENTSLNNPRRRKQTSRTIITLLNMLEKT
jgi:hypothetical protein